MRPPAAAACAGEHEAGPRRDRPRGNVRFARDGRTVTGHAAPAPRPTEGIDDFAFPGGHPALRRRLGCTATRGYRAPAALPRTGQYAPRANPIGVTIMALASGFLGSAGWCGSPAAWPPARCIWGCAAAGTRGPVPREANGASGPARAGGDRARR